MPALLTVEGSNTLLIRTPIEAGRSVVRFSSVALGHQIDRLPAYERRMFWVNTMPRITIVAGLLVAGFALFVWWRRRSEALYGLFGLAAALWGVRTSTFVSEALPPTWWHYWQLIVLTATAGFVVVLAIFTFRLAGRHWPDLERALLAYWLTGTVWFLAAGPDRQLLVNKVWTGGLIPSGLLILGVSAWKEALTNVLKHARASKVEVRLARQRAEELLLEVEDNGAGLTGAPERHSRGLINRLNRASRLGGRLAVRSGSGCGTCVALHLRLPLAHATGSVRTVELQARTPAAGQKEGSAVPTPQANAQASDQRQHESGWRLPFQVVQPTAFRPCGWRRYPRLPSACRKNRPP